MKLNLNQFSIVEAAASHILTNKSNEFNFFFNQNKSVFCISKSEIQTTTVMTHSIKIIKSIKCLYAGLLEWEMFNCWWFCITTDFVPENTPSVQYVWILFLFFALFCDKFISFFTKRTINLGSYRINTCSFIYCISIDLLELTHKSLIQTLFAIEINCSTVKTCLGLLQWLQLGLGEKSLMCSFGCKHKIFQLNVCCLNNLITTLPLKRQWALRHVLSIIRASGFYS